MIDDYCCACITQGDCSAHPEHTCGLSREEIESDIAAREELMETYASLKPGEKKQVPSTGQLDDDGNVLSEDNWGPR
jgi:hypothetical protein